MGLHRTPADAKPRLDSGKVSGFPTAQPLYLKQITILFCADWHPRITQMPEIVAHGHKPAVLACGIAIAPMSEARMQV